MLYVDTRSKYSYSYIDTLVVVVVDEVYSLGGKIVVFTFTCLLAWSVFYGGGVRLRLPHVYCRYNYYSSIPVNSSGLVGVTWPASPVAIYFSFTVRSS